MWRTTFATLLAGGVVGSATWVVFFSSIFGVRHVVVTGNATVSAEEVRRVAGIPAGTPMATVDLGEVDRRIAGLRAVESVRSDRSWPGTLRVAIVERTPLAAVPTGGRTAVVDRFGVVLETVDVAPPRLPVLRVQRLGQADPATRTALKVLATLPADVLRRVREVRAPSGQWVSLRLSDGRTVIWGDAERPVEKARVLKTLLRTPAASYDVSSPDVVTVK
jgi:cell division protein FtsQ